MQKVVQLSRASPTVDSNRRFVAQSRHGSRIVSLWVIRSNLGSNVVVRNQKWFRTLATSWFLTWEVAHVLRVFLGQSESKGANAFFVYMYMSVVELKLLQTVGPTTVCYWEILQRCIQGNLFIRIWVWEFDCRRPLSAFAHFRPATFSRR